PLFLFPLVLILSTSKSSIPLKMKEFLVSILIWTTIPNLQLTKFHVALIICVSFYEKNVSATICALTYSTKSLFLILNIGLNTFPFLNIYVNNGIVKFGPFSNSFYRFQKIPSMKFFLRT